MNKSILLFCLLALSVSAQDWRSANWREIGSFVTVGPAGISPSNTVAAITEVARLAAQAEVNAVKADLLAEAMEDADAKATAFEAVVQAREGTIWVDSLNVLRIGERAVDPEVGVTSEIIRFDPMVAEDGDYWVNRTFAFFSRDPGYVPFVRIGNNLTDSNSWFQATSVNSYSTNGVLVAGTLYDNVFVTEFLTPKAWSNANARVVSEVRGATTNATLFAVNNGIRVKGEEPLTLSVDYGTNQIRIVGGVWCLPR